MSNGFETARAQELTRAIIESFESNAAAVICFSLQASVADIGELSSALSSEEIVRSDRFRVPAIGQRFVICRGRLRLILAALLEVPPSEIRFQMGVWGKPYLSRDHGLPLQFNVSHSASTARPSSSDSSGRGDHAGRRSWTDALRVPLSPRPPA